MQSSWQHYLPSAFDTPEAFMQIEDRYVEILGEPEKKLSLQNMAIILISALFTLGFSLFLAGEKWWYSRRCNIRTLGIDLCTRTPAHVVSMPVAHAPDSDTLAERCGRSSRFHWQMPVHLPHSCLYVTDAVCLAFLEQIKNKNSQAIERMPLRFKPRQILFEQVALEGLESCFDARGRIDMKFETAAELHGLSLCEQWVLHDLEEIAPTLKSHQSERSLCFLKGYYCLFGSNPHESDHHLLVYFERDARAYIFNPYQGVLRLKPDGDHTPHQLFMAYCHIQLRERCVEKLSMAYFEHA